MNQKKINKIVGAANNDFAVSFVVEKGWITSKIYNVVVA